jgi:hypothetical protein
MNAKPAPFVATSDISTPRSWAIDPMYENKTIPAKILVKLKIFKNWTKNYCIILEWHKCLKLKP